MKVTVTLLVLALLGFGATNLRSPNQVANSSTQNAGRQTREERIRSVYKGAGARRNLRQLAAKATQDIEVNVGPGMPVLAPNPSAFNLQAFLEGMACDADAVVIGEVNKASAQLTEDESFVFTNYEMTVEEVLKSDGATPPQKDSLITVARTGGMLNLGRRKIRARVHGFAPLEAGKRYLLFLQSVPGKGAYIAHESKGSFLLDGDEIVKLTEDQLPPELESGNDVGGFINAVRQAAGTPCAGKARQ